MANNNIFIIWSDLNEIGFGVEVISGDIGKAKEVALEGWFRWNDPVRYPEYEACGYVEPSMELMDEAGIKYRILDNEEITDPDNPDFFIKGAERLF